MNLAEISPIGWCVVAVMAFFILSINLWLFALLRNRSESANARRSDNHVIRQTLMTLRDPFANESDRMKELAQKVDQFKPPPDE